MKNERLKRLISAAMAAALCLSLAGCGERCADSVANGRLRDRRNEGSGLDGWNNGELRGIRFFGNGRGISGIL